jgi:hypothetical protein
MSQNMGVAERKYEVLREVAKHAKRGLLERVSFLFGIYFAD